MAIKSGGPGGGLTVITCDRWYAPAHKPKPRMHESHPEVAQKWDAAAARARR